MKPFRQRNYYELLEVPLGATTEEIRGAYQRALERGAESVQDRLEPEHLEELRDLLGKALSVLTDSQRRRRYDRSIGQGDGASETRDGAERPTQLALAEILEMASSPRLPPSERLKSYFPRPPASADVGRSPPLAAPRSSNELSHAPVLAEESAIANAETALVHASARGQQLRIKPVEIPPEADFNGELLRRIRESRGLGIQEVAERTRIPVKHLENIEADRYNGLPATVYLRGILVSLARELRLDPMRVARSYIGLVGEVKAKGK